MLPTAWTRNSTTFGSTKDTDDLEWSEVLPVAVVGVAVLFTWGSLSILANRVLTASGVTVVVDVAIVVLALCLGLAFQAAQRRKEESEAQLRAVVDSARDGVLVIDDGGVIESFNPAAERLFGFTAEEVTGINISMLIPVPEGLSYEDYVQRYLHADVDESAELNADLYGAHKGGGSFPMELAVRQLPGTGKKARYLWVVRDVTERKATQRQLERAQREAVAESNARRAFLAHMSREMSTTMDAISALKELKHGGRIPGQGRRVDEMAHNGEALAKSLGHALES